MVLPQPAAAFRMRPSAAHSSVVPETFSENLLEYWALASSRSRPRPLPLSLPRSSRSSRSWKLRSDEGGKERTAAGTATVLACNSLEADRVRLGVADQVFWQCLGPCWPHGLEHLQHYNRNTPLRRYVFPALSSEPFLPPQALQAKISKASKRGPVRASCRSGIQHLHLSTHCLN